MNTIESLKIRYEKTKENDELVQDKNYNHVYVMKNEKERKTIRDEYIKLLPKNKRLAIYLHDKLCHSNHTDMCSWYYEIKGLEDDWTSWTHDRYLSKANKALDVCENDEIIMNLVEAIIN